MTDPEAPEPSVRVDTDKSRLDVDLIHRFLTTSYWARGIPVETVRSSIANSLCFGLYEGREQIGFARLVTDYATFAYLADVFVLESRRGRGLAKVLMQAVVSHPQVQGLRRWLLGTRDAHGLYQQFGFTQLRAPDRFMERHDPEVYAAPRATGDGETGR